MTNVNANKLHLRHPIFVAYKTVNLSRKISFMKKLIFMGVVGLFVFRSLQ